MYPVLFTVAITVKIVGEWAASSQDALQVWLDTAIYVSLIVSTALYVWSLHRTKKNTEENV